MRTETKVLIAMRKEMHLTQKQMADIFGWTTSQFISNAERGKCGFPPEHLELLALNFGKAWANKIIRAKVKDFERQLRSACK